MGLRIVVAPDSFKGSVAAAQAATAIAQGWRDRRPDDTVVERPMADGGEGTVSAIAAAHPGARRHELEVLGPHSRPVRATWVMLGDGTAVTELAQGSGLPLMDRPDPLGAHTHGLGETIAAALDEGAQRILVGLGGSASTDGGTGCLTALGARFLDAGGRPLPLGGGGLVDLVRVELAGLRPAPAGGVVCLSDVVSPLLGPQGAAATFGPQKGADTAGIDLLERGLGRLADHLGYPCDRPGDGAAGGTGYGLRAAWGASLHPGASVVADVTGLAETLQGADLLIAGEGRFDATSMSGKVVGYLAERAHTAGVGLAIVTGQAGAPPPPGCSDLVTLVDLAGGPDGALAEPVRWLRAAGAQLAERANLR